MASPDVGPAVLPTRPCAPTRRIPPGDRGDVRLAHFVDRRVVARVQREVEPVLVAAADTVGDGLGQTVRLGPDHLGAEDEAEVVDAADGVAPRDADERLAGHPGVLRRGVLHVADVVEGGSWSVAELVGLVAGARPPAVLVAEVDPDGPGRLDDAHHLLRGCDERVHELGRGSLGADLPVVVFAAVLVGPQAEVGRAGHDEVDAVVGQVEVERVALQDGHAGLGHIWSIHVESFRLAHEVVVGVFRGVGGLGMVGS